MLGEYSFFIDGRVPVLKVHGEPRPAPAVLVLHGLGASLEVHRKELGSLAEHGLTAVAMDAPHHGARRDGLLDEMARLAPAEAHARFLRLVLAAVPEVSRVLDHLASEGHGPLGVVGVSMGAYVALAAAAADARIRATVSILGSPDWSHREGLLTEELHELAQYAPVHRPADCARHPLLLINAGRDVNVPPHFARGFARWLAEHRPALAGHVSYVEYPESDHFVRPEDWEDLWQRTLGFLRRHLS
jgi:pimeloyl-ACP methyl ester carboxylesterase